MNSLIRFLLAAGMLPLIVPVAPVRADILYASYEVFGQKVVKYTSDHVGTLVADSTNLVGPTGLAFDSAANLYVANAGVRAGVGSPIVKISPGGSATIFASVGLISPGGIAFDSMGYLYMTNRTNNTIVRFSSDGVASVFASLGLNRPGGLAFDLAGNLYVANTSSNNILKFTPGGVGSVFASTGLNAPTGLAFDRAGNLYAGNYQSHTIERFAPDGLGTVFADFTNGIFEPTALAFDSKGNLYVANDGGGPIAVVAPIPSGFSFFSTPGFSNPSGLAFTDDFGVPLKLANQIPEPATLGLLALGFMVLPGFFRVRGRTNRVD